MPKSYSDESMSTRIKGQESDPAAIFEELARQNALKEEKMTPAAIEIMKTEATKEVRDVLQILEKTHSGITEGVATAVGAGTGAVGSIAALSTMGVAGLSSVGISTGLAAAGGLLGGGMLVGIGVLATPVVALGALGYTLSNKRKKVQSAAALGVALKKICDIQSRLLQHENHFREELANIKTTLEVLTQTKTA